MITLLATAGLVMTVSAGFAAVTPDAAEPVRAAGPAAIASEAISSPGLIVRLDPLQHRECAARRFHNGDSLSPGLDAVNAAVGVVAFERAIDMLYDPELDRHVSNLMEVFDRARAGDPAKASRVNREGVIRDLEVVLSTYLVDLPPGTDAKAAAEMYRQLPDVLDAEPTGAFQLFAWQPADPYFHSGNSWGHGTADLWGIHRIGAAGAWQRTRGWPSVIAISDTGLEWRHPDLSPNMHVRPGDFPNGVDDDGNGFVDDFFNGYDFIARAMNAPTGGGCTIANRPPPPNQWPGNVHGAVCDDDAQGHGTHVAGIAAAAANGSGIVGVAPEARLMPIKLFSPFFGVTGQQLATAILQGLLYSALYGADVLNASWGVTFGIRPEISLLYNAGVTTVVAAGNDQRLVATQTYPYPAAYNPLVVTVSATSPNDAPAWFTNFGPEVDVGAPGGTTVAQTCTCTFDGSQASSFCASTTRTFLSTRSLWWRQDYHPRLQGPQCSQDFNLNLGQTDYALLFGTSMAAPHVAGALALAQSVHWWAGPRDLMFWVRRSATDAGPPGFDAYTGYGRLNANRLVNSTTAIPAFEDAFVEQEYPNRNNGSDADLKLSGVSGLRRIAYLKFDLRSVPAQQGVALRWCAKTSAAQAGHVYGVDSGAWTEGGVTWTSRPGYLTGPLAQVEDPGNGTIAAGVCTVTDLTPWVPPSRIVSLAVEKTGTDPIAFHSRETTAAPHLLVVACQPTGCNACDGSTIVTANVGLLPLAASLFMSWGYSAALRRRRRRTFRKGVQP